MIRMAFVGDVSLGEHYFSFGHGPRTFAQKNYIFKNVEEKLHSADYAIANLEGPISDSGIDNSDPESIVFRASPDIVQQLVRSKINIVNIANNHILQHGKAILDDTVNTLTQNGINVIGLNNAPPLIVSKDAQQIAIFGCSDVPDNKYKDQDSYQICNDLFFNTLAEAVKKYSCVMVIIHWGREDTHQPTLRQIEVERRLRDTGVKYVIGHHPHIFYPIKREPDFFCAYSLGDFVFDLPWDRKLLETGILDISINEDGTTASAKVTPVYLSKQGCLPEISGPDLEIPEGITLAYHYSSAVDGLQVKKLKYFITNFLKGNTSLKLTFIFKKIISKVIKK
jgi:poly-gamma-glutamate capsule biosynthesis protein CapA/YwtB (metallophosphatase superfamily)